MRGGARAGLAGSGGEIVAGVRHGLVWAPLFGSFFGPPSGPVAAPISGSAHQRPAGLPAFSFLTAAAASRGLKAGEWVMAFLALALLWGAALFPAAARAAGPDAAIAGDGAGTEARAEAGTGAARADAGDGTAYEAAYVVLGEGGRPVARVLTRAAACPAILIDGRAVPMRLRAAPGTEALRPTQSAPALSKPSAFSVRACERALPRQARHVSVQGKALPLPPRRMTRIVVIGDTGCRLKAKDDAWQACADPAAYPFARVAAAAAAWKPDLVVHVGDYLYRENPCPEGQAGCAGSPWGYGWDAWNADFFAPARPLLAAAPWVVVRGNHESCSRGGQGWWRLLDPRPLLAGRDCNDPADDARGDVSPAYAVPLGGGAQIVVMDLSAAGTKKLKPDDPRIPVYRDTARALARYAAGKRFTFATDHYPFFGVGADAGKNGAVKLHAGSKALQPAFAQVDPAILPKGVDALLAGHIHLWQQVDFGGREPSQFVAGFSGTQEDIVPLPETLPDGVEPAPGVPVRGFAAIVASFGFMTLERTGPRRWRALVHDERGAIIRRCRIDGRRSSCD